MKQFSIIISLTLFLSACQADKISPTPTITPSLSPTETRPTPTETKAPITIPETLEQRIERLVTVVSWNPNDEKTWIVPTGLNDEDVAYLEELKATDADPNVKTDQQLKDLDAFQSELRRVAFERLLTDTKSYLIKRPENLRSAIILKEILDKPLALREI